MESNKKKDFRSKKERNPYNIYYENYLDTNACTECTGLIPNAADRKELWNAYHEIFDFTPKKADPNGSD